MRETISKIFREIEHDIGTRELTTLVFESMLKTVKHFKIDDIKKFQENFQKILEHLNNTQPRFAIIIDHCTELYKHLVKITAENSKLSGEEVKQQILKKGREIFKKDRHAKKRLLHHASKFLNLENKRILIFDHSHTVQDVLNYLHSQGQKFQVIIAEQDIEKTEENITSLDKAHIPFHVVPAYMLSHYEEEIDMLFFGGLTFKSTYEFVVDTGSLALISEFHLLKKPIYMFMTTSKFAFWKAEKKTEVFSHPHIRKHSKKPIEYQRMKFSHDRIPMELFTNIITDEGIFTGKQLREFYDRKFQELVKQSPKKT